MTIRAIAPDGHSQCGQDIPRTLYIGLLTIGLPCQAELFALKAEKKGWYILWSGFARPQDVPFLPSHVPGVKPQKAPFPLCQKSNCIGFNSMRTWLKQTIRR